MYHKFLSHEHIITYNTTQRNKHKQSEKGREGGREGRKKVYFGSDLSTSGKQCAFHGPQRLKQAPQRKRKNIR